MVVSWEGAGRRRRRETKAKRCGLKGSGGDLRKGRPVDERDRRRLTRLAERAQKAIAAAMKSEPTRAPASTSAWRKAAD
jgi:hypothetical protein